MKNILSIIIVLMLALSVYAAGSAVLIGVTPGHKTYMIKPTCKNATSDTIGSIKTEYAKNFSITFLGNKLTHKDTAIVDSGFFIYPRLSYTTAKNSLFAPGTADSTLQLWGNDTIKVRTKAKSKGLTLDSAPYFWLIIKRWDTNADTLDFKKSTGVIDTCLIVDFYGEK